jgi:hypothetical protein
VARSGYRGLRIVDVAVSRLYFQVLPELAHHCGHADILREQVLAG